MRRVRLLGAVGAAVACLAAVGAALGRMFSTSRFKGLTQAYLKLNMNSDSKEGNGGSCFGDSGSPRFVHGTNLAVATTFGGDPICRSENINSRLDTVEARAFYGQFLALP